MEEHKKYGGIPENCVVYELYLYHLVEDDGELREIYERCRSGDLTCGKCKRLCYEMLEEFLKDLNEKREVAREEAWEILKE